MSEKTEKPSNTDVSVATAMEKLFIDNPSDFQFHAAYLAYSNAFDRTTSIEIKKQLNQNIIAVQQNQIDYATFYRNIAQYRALDGTQHRFGRTFMKTQKKSDWRREMQKRERNKRHGR